MTPEEALNIVATAAAEFRGTLKDHQTIQEALAILAKLVEAQKETPAS